MARNVVVSAVSCPPVSGEFQSDEERVEAGLRQQLTWLDRAAHQSPDVILLPEVNAWGAVPIERWHGSAQGLDGPVLTQTAERARRYGCHIICPMVLKKGRSVYNALVAIDRKGRVLGAYYKVVPTIGEMEAGIRPGRRNVVLATDFGRVGFAICFDLNFEEVFRSAKGGGAEMVFFSSMYRGGLQNRVWAYQYEVFIVGATPNENSLIVDPLGRVIAQSHFHQPIQTVTLNLDCRVLHLDYNMERFDAIERKYGRSVRLDVLSPEALVLLTSQHPRKTAEDIIAEFQLETRQQYYARARRVRARALRRR